MEEVGAMEEFERTLVGGTRREDAAEGGGRSAPFPGRGGASMLPNVGGLRRGGLGGIVTVGGASAGVSMVSGGPRTTGSVATSFFELLFASGTLINSIVGAECGILSIAGFVWEIVAGLDSVAPFAASKSFSRVRKR